MAIQESVELRNNQLNAITTTAGGGAFLKIFDNSNGVPANCAAASTGVILISFICATPFAPAAVNAVLSPTIPQTVNALAGGTALYYRLFKADGITCVRQDLVVAAGNGLVLNPSNNVIVIGMPQGVNSWTITIGGA